VSFGDDIHAALTTYGVTLVSYVPDAGHKRLIERCDADPAMRTVGLTTEEEGIALATGAWLGGTRAALLMQSSGVGNCVNMLSLVKTTGVPFLMIVTMRGEWGEENPWQLPMGQATPAVLQACDLIVHRCDDPAAAGETVAAAARLAFGSSRGVAVLLGQRLVGAKAFVEDER
jgi:sulfopyruvate decarboxylase alpha subunit